MTVLRALRLAVAKVAEDEFDLAVPVIGLTDSQSSAAQVIDCAEDTALLVLLDTPNGGPGAAILDASLVEGLVQQQTMGRVYEANEDQRAPTRTDAALVSSYLEQIFRRAGPMPEEEDERRLLSGIKYGAYMPAARLLVMALEAPSYTHFALTLDLATGTRQGRLDLLLPSPRKGPDLTGLGHDDQGGVLELGPPQTLERVALRLHADLRIALCRLRLTLADVSDLSPGDVLPVPIKDMSTVDVLSLDGAKVGQGRLGHVDGRRAVKLGAGHQSGDAPQRRASDQVEGAPRVEYTGEDRRGGPRSLPAPSKEETKPARLPSLPSADAASAVPDLPELPDIPEIRGLADLDGLPDLPDLIGEDGKADAPLDLPSLPDLPDLPPLS